jgi:hypothetical protein
VPTYKLDISDEFDFQLIGISSHEKDYRVAWAINLALGWNLERQEEVTTISKNKKNLSDHGVFSFEAEEDKTMFVLVENRSSTGLLLPSLQQFQYLLKVENLADGRMQEIIVQLKKSPLILTAYEVSLNAAKEKQNLIFD